jgi:hypothetical protein
MISFALTICADLLLKLSITLIELGTWLVPHIRDFLSGCVCHFKLPPAAVDSHI